MIPLDDTGRGGAPALSPPVVAVGLAVGVLAVSTAAILVRVAGAPALSLAFYRCAGGALALAPFAWRARRRARGRPRLPHGLLAAAGVLLALHFALWIASLSFTSVASSVVLVTASPLFVGAGTAVLLAEPVSRRTWAGALLAVAGAIGIGLADFDGTPAGGRALVGNAMAFGGAVMVAGYLLIGRSLRQRLPVSVYAAAVYGAAAVVLLAACLAAGVPLRGYQAGTWLAIAGLVVGPQLLGHTVFNALLSTVSATVVAVVVVAEPVGATALAWALLSEVPPPGFWLAAPLVLAGVYLATTRRSPGE